MCVLVWHTALAEGVLRSGPVADKDTASVDWDTQPVWMRTHSMCGLEHTACVDEDTRLCGQHTACVEEDKQSVWMTQSLCG